MKKPGLIAPLIFIAYVGLFTGCKTTDEGPSIQFFGGSFIDDNVTVAPGQSLNSNGLLKRGAQTLFHLRSVRVAQIFPVILMNQFQWITIRIR